MKRTKIVATLGPASESPENIAALIDAGVNVFRFNFSHGDREAHRALMRRVREIAAEKQQHIGILQDLSGPKIRIGDFTTETVTLEKGKKIILTTEECAGTADRVSVNYPNLPQELYEGNPVLLDDGKVRLRVLEFNGNDITCEIEMGGTIRGRRGLNLPGAKLSISSMTEKDWKDVEIGIDEKAEYIALSFVRSAKDVEELKTFLKKRNCTALVMSKVETAEAVERLDEVINASDAVMVARGDLSVELPMEQVPVLQKRMVRIARSLGKPVIVATQMMESMVHSKVPTRAEISDVSNAIFDGADAVMTSNETAVGDNPVETIAMMSRIAFQVEQSYPERSFKLSEERKVVDAITQAVSAVAHTVKAKAIIALTESGSTARSIARLRSDLPLFAITPSESTARTLNLSFGVRPIVHTEELQKMDVAIEVAKKVARDSGAVKAGELFILVAGMPFGEAGSTNAQMVLQA